MKKFWAILCTISFSVFWVFGGLSLMAYWDGHPLFAVVALLSLLGLGLGLWSRKNLYEATRQLPRGQRVMQREAKAEDLQEV